jgi:hypothetical protein
MVFHSKSSGGISLLKCTLYMTEVLFGEISFRCESALRQLEGLTPFMYQESVCMVGRERGAVPISRIWRKCPDKIEYTHSSVS